MAWGCGESPALRVGDVTFTSSDLLGLSDDQVQRLILITTVGLGTAREETHVLGARAMEGVRDDLRIERLREVVSLEEAGIDEDSLRSIYRGDPEPELIVRHLVILSERWESEPRRSEARFRAAEALDRARAGSAFPELVAEFSEEPGAAARGGRLEPGREGTWVREFWDAAVALEEGEVSDVVESPYGFHVLKLEERRAVPFEDARPTLMSRVASAAHDDGIWEARVSEWMAQTDPARTPGGASAADHRRQALIAEADRRGITLSEAEMARIRTGWEGRVMRWATAFGFEAGMTTGAISDQSIEALGRTGQDARIARDEILGWAPSLEAAYRVERSTP